MWLSDVSACLDEPQALSLIPSTAQTECGITPPESYVRERKVIRSAGSFLAIMNLGLT